VSTNGSSPTTDKTPAPLTGAWPRDWKWCGCGAPNRRLTEAEAKRALLVIAAAAAAASLAAYKALAVLDDLAWPMEMHQRSRLQLCTCNGTGGRR
jgi:hypothetical protein